MSAGRIEVDRVSIELGDAEARFEVLHDVSVTVEAGEFICLLGPSGCGKSTLLGALAGHLSPSKGSLKLDGAPIAGPDHDRGIYPWQLLRELSSQATALIGAETHSAR